MEGMGPSQGAARFKSVGCSGSLLCHPLLAPRWWEGDGPGGMLGNAPSLFGLQLLGAGSGPNRPLVSAPMYRAHPRGTSRVPWWEEAEVPLCAVTHQPMPPPCPRHSQALNNIMALPASSRWGFPCHWDIPRKGNHPCHSSTFQE